MIAADKSNQWRTIRDLCWSITDVWIRVTALGHGDRNSLGVPA